jgi:hypothetical protein
LENTLTASNNTTAKPNPEKAKAWFFDFENMIGTP